MDDGRSIKVGSVDSALRVLSEQTTLASVGNSEGPYRSGLYYGEMIISSEDSLIIKKKPGIIRQSTFQHDPVYDIHSKKCGGCSEKIQMD
ncbi:hypothetical protein RclHR1_06950007 [Rhizophagus clarus]|uniref:Uncharacterized protein n=1 Tax=Rhizophagus clarus TaxID=94130 RepID=A0A2Z6RWA9_9GLOM|nr:hypothetical protein RclHR1_06950007 [Rhizophagus clarus]